MSVNVRYKGVDITSSIDIKQCIHDMYAEQHGDTLMLKFKDSEKLWDKWSPKTGDQIAVEKGNAKSGVMYIKETEPLAGHYIVRAGSLPLSTELKQSRSWEGITYIQLGKDIANRHGLVFKQYGITDRKYAFLRQSMQTDMKFYEDISVLEGNAFLIYDGALIVYNESYMESQAVRGNIAVKGDSGFHYSEKKLYSGCTISNGTMSYTYLQDDSYGFVAEETVSIFIESQADTERYAKNMLRYKNKEKKSGFFYTKPIAEDFSAGSIAKISTNAAQSYDGKAFISHIRHDYMNGKSKIFFRKPLEE